MTAGVPVALTSFVGRQAELVAVGRLLGERRLVTLTGVGGCGKTRLAAELLARIAGQVCWVDLSSVTDQDLVARLVAAALDVMVEPEGDPLQVLARMLRSRHLLLCLDTCEHLLDAVAELTRVLLQTCPHVSVLTTSRQPLGVMGEAVWRVPPLDVDDGYRLFVDRAELVAPGVSESADEAQVRAVCLRVDGLPLAIELAAAWVRALPPWQIAAGLEDSFRLLAGGPRSALPRHQTLQASLDWSHDLLDEPERVLFRRLSVFAGTFTLAGVSAVCGIDDVLVVLGRMLDKSLVVLRQDGAEVRYRLLDTVRQYAEEKLRAAGEVEDLRDRHLDHFLTLAVQGAPELERDQDTWRRVLDSHRDDISAALRWALGAPGGQERGRHLCAAMSRQWFVRGQTREGLEFLGRAADIAPDDRSVVQGRLVCGQAMLGMVAGRRDLCVDAAERGMRIAVEVGDDTTKARCLVMVGYGAFFADFDECEQLAPMAYELGAAADDPFARDWGRVLAAYSLTTRDRHADAVALARTAYELSWPRGDRFCAAFAQGSS